MAENNNVSLTIYIRNQTVDSVLPYLKWALDHKLEAMVSFEDLVEEEIPRATDFTFGSGSISIPPSEKDETWMTNESVRDRMLVNQMHKIEQDIKDQDLAREHNITTDGTRAHIFDGSSCWCHDQTIDNLDTDGGTRRDHIIDGSPCWCKPDIEYIHGKGRKN